MSNRIDLSDIRVGDTIMAIRNDNGVNARKTGLVGYINDYGYPYTNQGECLAQFRQGKYDLRSADSITLKHRPAPKGFETLDKSKTYYVRSKTNDQLIKWFEGWYLKFIDGAWYYGGLEDTNTPADDFEHEFTNGGSAWHPPEEVTPLEEGFYYSPDCKLVYYVNEHSAITVSYSGNPFRGSHIEVPVFKSELDAGEILKLRVSVPF